MSFYEVPYYCRVNPSLKSAERHVIDAIVNIRKSVFQTAECGIHQRLPKCSRGDEQLASVFHVLQSRAASSSVGLSTASAGLYEQIRRVFSNGCVLSYFRPKTVLTFGTTILISMLSIRVVVSGGGRESFLNNGKFPRFGNMLEERSYQAMIKITTDYLNDTTNVFFK